jgi:hypothetical protein
VAAAKKLQREFSSLETVYNRLYAAYSKEPDVDAGPLIQDLQAIREAAEALGVDLDSGAPIPSDVSAMADDCLWQDMHERLTKGKFLEGAPKLQEILGIAASDKPLEIADLDKIFELEANMKGILTKAFADALVKQGKTPQEAEIEAEAQATELLQSEPLNLRGQARIVLDRLCAEQYETPFAEALKAGVIEYNKGQYVEAILAELQAQLLTQPEMTDPANAELFTEKEIVGPDGKVIKVQSIIIDGIEVYMDENRQIIEMTDIFKGLDGVDQHHIFGNIDPKKIIDGIEHRPLQMVTDNLTKGPDGNGKGPNMEDGRGL